jgi:hypothetical protein
MNSETFRKYIESRRKLDKEFNKDLINIETLDKQYEKIKAKKEKHNEYMRSYHKDMMENDETFKAKRKEYNKKSFDTFQKNHPDKIYKKKEKNIKPVEKPIEKPLEKPIEKPIEEVKPVEEKLSPLFYNTVGF